ncbi:cyclomaltodextrinase / maltogenic alpha-amylase / neopullulanase [Candidatus Hakubella thermalkaliphila]|nr:cyclomaltodextrinase / maltogenic alpha-amylase / neopullulanase [Candidatus Hakubella thermalkaliphila]
MENLIFGGGGTPFHSGGKEVPSDPIFGGLDTTSGALSYLGEAKQGVSHRNHIYPQDAHPGQETALMVNVGDSVRADRLFAYYTTDGTDPCGSRGKAIQGFTVSFTRESSKWDPLIWGYREEWKGIIPPQADGTKVRYIIEAWDSLGDKSFFADNNASDSLQATRFSYLVDDLDAPTWAQDAIIYHLLIDRFYPGDDIPGWLRPGSPLGFYGGTLQGIMDKLPYLADLGVTCLWLSPMWESPSHHGYDIVDYTVIAQRYGGNRKFQQLVEAAHSLGLRIILDFVANHSSDQHPFFLAAQTDQESPYYHWYCFTRWPEEYRSFFGVKWLPQWNLDYEPTRKYIIDQAVWWVKEYGIDGYRLDYALGPSHDFWVDFRQAVKEVNPETLLIGEVVHGADVIRSYEGRLDGCLDFLLAQKIHQVFASTILGVEALDSFLERQERHFSKHFVLPTFLDNHDMNRFLWMARGDKRRLKLAALCQFTLPQPPIIYYGTEVGLSQERNMWTSDGYGHHEYARMPMLWGEAQDQDLLEYYRHLCAIRRENSVLRRGRRITLHLDAVTNTYAYALQGRGHADGEKEIVVIINSSEDVRSITVSLLPPGFPENTVLQDLIDGQSYKVRKSHLKLTLNPLQGIILTRAKA